MIRPTLHELERTAEALTDREKLALIEHLARSLRTSDPSSSPERQLEALARLRQELAVLPVRNPQDGLSNRDHDRLLYGDKP